MAQAAPKGIRQIKHQKQTNRLELVKSGTNKQIKVSTFKIFMVICIALAVVSSLKVIEIAYLNQFSIENHDLEVKMTAAKQIQQELAMKEMALKSPTRIQEIAVNKLRMVSPKKFSYIVFDSKKLPMTSLLTK